MSSWFGIAGGVVLVAVGVLAYRWFSPSPHGYLELFYAVPLMALGLLIMGLGLASGWRTIGWALKAVAVLLVVGGLGPLGLIVYLRLIA
jgi:hypothetical protein